MLRQEVYLQASLRVIPAANRILTAPNRSLQHQMDHYYTKRDSLRHQTDRYQLLH